MSKPEGLHFVAAGPVRIVVRSEIPAIHSTAGQMITPKQRRLYAQFIRGETPGWAAEVGKSLYSGEVASRPDVPIERWIGYYDTLEGQRRENWTDEEVVLIEAKLKESLSCTLVEQPKMEAPWPAYDKLIPKGRRTAEMVAEKIAETAQDTGVDVDRVIAYEAENLNRPEVIQALTDLHAEPDALVESDLVA